MTLDEIKELIQVLLESGVAELEVQRGDQRVRITRATQPLHREVVAPAAPAAAAIPQTATPGVSQEAQAESLVHVKSPIVGTYYDAPSPDAPSFVRVGDTVQAGQVLCIIESMKLMNEIEAEISGVIEAKLVENGKPVEYGEALFAVRPL
jgi:acetyl-CoA carboxylase biotin carboxyl carrier protein